MNSEQTDQDNLESLAEMLDTALTSQDPRVVSALRQLMIMVALTRPDAAADKNTKKYDYDIQQYRNPWSDSMRVKSEYRDAQMLKKLQSIKGI